MKLRPIRLKTKKDKYIEIPVEGIKNIKLSPDKVEIILITEPFVCETVSYFKDDYWYAHWRSFINQIVRVFEIEEIEIV